MAGVTIHISVRASAHTEKYIASRSQDLALYTPYCLRAILFLNLYDRGFSH